MWFDCASVSSSHHCSCTAKEIKAISSPGLTLHCISRWSVTQLTHIPHPLQGVTLYRVQHGRRNFKDINPLLSSLLVSLFGMVKQFCRFWIWSETECKTPAEYGTQHNSTPPPPPPNPTFFFLFFYFFFGRGGGGGGGGQREDRGATVHKLGRKY